MTPVAYITPNFSANAVRFIEALTAMYDVRLVIISQEPATLLPAWQQSRISVSRKIPDVFDSNALIKELVGIQNRSGHFRIARVEGLERIRTKYNDIITDIKIPKPGQEASPNYEGEGYIILRHPDSNVVENALGDIVENVKVYLEYYSPELKKKYY